MPCHVKLLEVEFKTDHYPIRKLSTAGTSPSLSISGMELKPPHWKAGTNRNHPVSFTKGKPAKVELTLQVSTKATVQIQGHTDGNHLTFTGFLPGHQGPPRVVKLSLTSNNALPNKVARLSEKITWSFMENPTKKQLLAETGPHEIFVLWGKPIVESSHWKMSNYPTYDRLRLLTDSKLAGNKSDINEIARAIHAYVNQNALMGDPNISYSRHGDGGQLWGLLPGGAKKGQCAEFSYLMELMNRLLGINAMQKHIRASTTVAGIEKRLSYEGHTQASNARFETRTCARHGTEMLQMTFGYHRSTAQEEASGISRYAINEGEGTCEVNGTLYPGLLGLIGTNSGGRKAAHNILLACEAKYAPNLLKSKKTGHNQYNSDRFLVWVTKADSSGNYGVCEISEEDQIKEAKQKGMTIAKTQADPFPSVPR